MEDVKRLGWPFSVIFLSALVIKLLDSYFHISYNGTLSTIIIVCALFLFGFALNKNRKKRSPAVFKKVVSILVVILLLFMQLGYFTIPYVSTAFNFFGIDAFYINMIYIFCGYLFAD